MRNLFILLLFALPMMAAAQTRKDYERVMSKFVQFYNNNQGDSVVNLFNPKDRPHIKHMWTRAAVDTLHKKYGTIRSFKYPALAAPKSDGVEFKVIYTLLEPNGFGLLLDKNKMVVTLAMFTSEPKYLKTKARK
jgi:hypothetical protein